MNQGVDAVFEMATRSAVLVRDQGHGGVGAAYDKDGNKDYSKEEKGGGGGKVLCDMPRRAEAEGDPRTAPRDDRGKSTRTKEGEGTQDTKRRRNDSRRERCHREYITHIDDSTHTYIRSPTIHQRPEPHFPSIGHTATISASHMFPQKRCARISFLARRSTTSNTTRGFSSCIILIFCIPCTNVII